MSPCQVAGNPSCQFTEAGGVPTTNGSIVTPVDRNVKTPWSHRQFCPRARSLFASHKHQPLWRVIPIRCKCWSCRYCAPLNAERLRSRVLSGKPTKFITLTVKPQDGETPAQAAKRCRQQIARLLTLIRKEWCEIEAAIILERTKKGWPHWHLCARCGWISQRWLSDKWLSLTGSRVVDIRKIHSDKHAAKYVTKYTVKTAAFTANAKLGRLYSFTSNYLMREQSNPQQSDWSFKLVKDHPLDVLRKAPAGGVVTYQAGFFEIQPSSTQRLLWDLMHQPGLPP